MEHHSIHKLPGFICGLDWFYNFFKTFVSLSVTKSHQCLVSSAYFQKQPIVLQLLLSVGEAEIHPSVTS
jgi:hypothetical protein